MGVKIGVDDVSVIGNDIKIIGFDKKLRAQSAPDTIFGDKEIGYGFYNTVKKSMPNAIIAEISPQALAGSTEAVIPFKKKIAGLGVYANDYLIGEEVAPETLSCKIYNNNVRQAVPTPGYGKDELDAKPYRLYEEHINDLATWNQEHIDMEFNQAAVERFGESLRHGVTETPCTPHWNANIFVCGLPQRLSVPEYSDNLVTYTENIVQKLEDSGNGDIDTPHVCQTLNQPNLSNISNVCVQKRLSRLKLPGVSGGHGFIGTISEIQATYLGDPAWSDRNLGSLYIAKDTLPENVQNWRGVLGAYKDILFVQNLRQPTLDITGTSTHGLSAQYYIPEDDQRVRNEGTCDTMFILGMGAFVHWKRMALRHIQQPDDYGMLIGHGTASTHGVQLPHYEDADGENDLQFSSMLVICRTPDYQ